MNEEHNADTRRLVDQWHKASPHPECPPLPDASVEVWAEYGRKMRHRSAELTLPHTRASDWPIEEPEDFVDNWRHEWAAFGRLIARTARTRNEM